mmetsp:Transcript_10101/g.23631  ORF Transcript_10101/g.23631 Transcript_10101/m.23631 type:complete len:446 (-) Transcript_10101:63-1400(-)
MCDSQSHERHQSSSSCSSVVDVGKQRHPSGFSEMTIRYHNFPQLPHGKGEDSTDSQPFRMHGLEWYLRIHPGGAASANGDDMVSLYLRCKSSADENSTIHAEFSLSLMRSDGQIDSTMSCPINSFRRKRKGWPNFVTRSRVMDGASKLLDDCGSLTVIVKVQLFQEVETDFVPRNTLDFVKLFDEANGITADEFTSSTFDTADVKLSVDGEIIRAHSLILKMASPFLASLCQDSEGEEDEIIPIVGVRPPVFRTLLRHVYGGVTPVDAWNADAEDEEPNILASPSMELLDAANRYGVLSLKILAETKVSSDISVANASDLILYADSKDAALLKERVVDYFCTHAEEIRRHPSFQKVRESTKILDQLLEALLSKRSFRSHSPNSNDQAYGSMSVNLLRKKLNERKLDYDGSREIMIQRLEKWDEINQQESPQADPIVASSQPVEVD